MNNSPIIYNDPSGHRQCYTCGPEDYRGYLDEINTDGGGSDGGDGGNERDPDPTTVLFCGSNINVYITERGPVCDPDAPLGPDWRLDGFYSLPEWRGYDYYVRFPGGKYLMAQNALNLITDTSKPLALTCYSAGTEACLMFATAWKEKGGKIQSMVLIGPTFEAFDEENKRQYFDHWFPLVQALSEDPNYHTDVLMYDDNSVLDQTAIDYATDNDFYQVVHRNNVIHGDIGKDYQIGQDILDWHLTGGSYTGK